MSKINFDFYKYQDFFIYTGIKILDAETFNTLKEKKEDISKIQNEFILDLINPKRQNILKWYNFQKDAEILEVNAGYGTLTELLCERAKFVTVLESSKQNAEIINSRLSDKQNLEIILGIINDIKINKQFDYIILSDILEFANVFFQDNNPIQSFISYFKKLLTPDGKLIIMASNKFGIKNWCGFRNPHTLNLFESLINYPNIPELNSFSKQELQKVLEQTEFKNIKFFYPTPTFTDAKQILSDDSICYFDNTDFANFSKSEAGYFNMPIVIKEIFHNDNFPFFANSYLIFANNKETENETIFYSKNKNNIITNFVVDKNGKKYIKKYNIKNIPKLKDPQNIHFLNYKKENDYFISEPIEGKSLYEILKEYIDLSDELNIKKTIQEFKNIINTLYPEQTILDFSTKNQNEYFLNANIKMKKILCIKNVINNFNFKTVFKKDNTYTIINYDDIHNDYLPVSLLIINGLSEFINYRYDFNLAEYLNKEELYIINELHPYYLK